MQTDKRLGQNHIRTNKRVGTEAHTNEPKDGDRSTYEQTKGWGQKHIRTNKWVGTEEHTNKQTGGDRTTYEQTNEWGQNHIRTEQIRGDRNVNTHTNGKTKSMQLYIFRFLTK